MGNQVYSNKGSGRAKAMKQDMVIEIMRKCKDSGACVDTTADDDTTTIA